MAPREITLPPIEARPKEIASGLFSLLPAPDDELQQAIVARNKFWDGHSLIPSWVNIDTVDLDRFFTKPSIALQCRDRLWKVMAEDHADPYGYTFIEPGAGRGAFYDTLPRDQRIGIDIVPGRPEFLVTDFLSWSPHIDGKRYAVIGNPPFGYRGWLALAFVNHAAMFADYIGMILPMSFQSDGKGSPKHRVIGAQVIQSEHLPPDCFTNEMGHTVKINALWQIWRRGVNNRPPTKSCDQWIDLFTVDCREERLCGHERIEEADWFLQRTYYGSPPTLVKDFSDVRYGCGYGIVIKKEKQKITEVLRAVDWSKYCNLAVHNCRHISMYHIRDALIEAGFVDV